MDDAVHFDPKRIEDGLRENRDRLADLAERIEQSAGRLESLTQDEQLLIWMMAKLVLLRL